MSLVFDGQRVETPGIETVSWLDDRTVPRVLDGTPRPEQVTAIVLHTVHGHLGPLRPGHKASKAAEAYARYQAATKRVVSWHLTVDFDGTVIQSADLVSWRCYHAGHVNAWTVGIELVQEADNAVYVDQIDAAVRLVTLLCERLAIPKRVPVAAPSRPLVGVVVPWMSPKEGGQAVRWPGVIGHRNVTRAKGPGDPGDHIFNALLRAGYAGVTP